MHNKIIITILSSFIIIDALLIFLILTISPVKLKRKSFTFEYGEEISTYVDYYVNANKSILKSVQLDLSHVSTDVGTYQASIHYFDQTEEFEIKIVDTIKPKVKLKKVQFDIHLGDVVKASDLIESVEDLSRTEVYFYDEETKQKTQKKSYNIPGSYIERIIVIDRHGNQSSALRVKIVVMENDIVPVFHGIDDMTIFVGEDYDLMEGVTATDDIEGDITSRIIIEGSVNNQQVGEYKIIYSVQDNVGNVTKVTRKVKVIKR